jgi:hypothetical protein
MWIQFQHMVEQRQALFSGVCQPGLPEQYLDIVGLCIKGGLEATSGLSALASLYCPQATAQPH